MMSDAGRRLRATIAATLLTLIVALAVSGCGSSSHPAASSDPQTLLHQTFSSDHTVKSGILDFSLVVTPTGSAIVQTPISISLAGPFQSRGAGRTPESAFTIGFSGLGKHGSFGVRTTASGAYVSLEGTNYALPASDVSKLRSSLSSGSGGQSAPGLSTLGIDPEGWLSDPRIVGTQTVDGALTEHLHAAVNVPAFIKSLDRVLTRETSSLHTSTGLSHISPATARAIAADVRDPTVDVYTGKSDATLRRLVVSAMVPVSGSTSTRLGGLTRASFRLTLSYSQLNRPQTIAAPTDVHSDAQLQTALRSIAGQIETGLDATVRARRARRRPGLTPRVDSLQVQPLHQHRSRQRAQDAALRASFCSPGDRANAHSPPPAAPRLVVLVGVGHELVVDNVVIVV